MSYRSNCTAVPLDIYSSCMASRERIRIVEAPPSYKLMLMKIERVFPDP
jgi:hypothetical protein